MRSTCALAKDSVPRKPRAEDTWYWYYLTPKERAGKRGREFKAFWKEWTRGWGKPIKSLVYEGPVSANGPQ